MTVTVSLPVFVMYAKGAALAMPAPKPAASETTRAKTTETGRRREARSGIDDSSGEALVIVGQFHERPSMHDSAARATRGGRERRVGLRKPVVVRRDRRTALPTFRRTARRSDRVSEGPPISPARRTGSQG